jgi:hypothetical protein
LGLFAATSRKPISISLGKFVAALPHLVLAVLFSPPPAPNFELWILLRKKKVHSGGSYHFHFIQISQANIITTTNIVARLRWYSYRGTTLIHRSITRRTILHSNRINDGF